MFNQNDFVNPMFNREFAPSNEELNAYRKGLTWNPEKIAESSVILILNYVLIDNNNLPYFKFVFFLTMFMGRISR